MINFLFLALLLIASSDASYFPEYLEGRPQSMGVTSLQPPDFRGEPVFRLEFVIKTRSGEERSGKVHRNEEEFVTFNNGIVDKFGVDSSLFPSEMTVDTLNVFMKSLESNKRLMRSDYLSDFLGINWSGEELKYIQSLPDFLYMLLIARVPEFMPEPPIIDDEDYLAPELPFERYLFVAAFRGGKENLDDYRVFFKSFLETQPAFDDDSESLLHPNTSTLNIPYHYSRTFVHFLPGGYLNGHTVRTSYLGKHKFNFLDEDKIEKQYQRFHPDLNPSSILDVGTGNCFSAMRLATMYPEANVVGVDLAAPYIRFCRRWAKDRGLTNVQFYQANAEEMDFFDSNSFDLVNVAYVLHEMPADNVRALMDEIMRVLKPGGVFHAFEVPYWYNPVLRAQIIERGTWGAHWDDDEGHGPEPYMEEYQNGAVLPELIKEMGFEDLIDKDYSHFDSVYTATKPL